MPVWDEISTPRLTIVKKNLCTDMQHFPTCPMMSPRFLLNDPNLSDSYRFYVIHMILSNNLSLFNTFFLHQTNLPIVFQFSLIKSQRARKEWWQSLGENTARIVPSPVPERVLAPLRNPTSWAPWFAPSLDFCSFKVFNIIFYSCNKTVWPKFT